MPKGIHKMLKKIFNLTMLVFAVPVFLKINIFILLKLQYSLEKSFILYELYLQVVIHREINMK